MKTSAPSRSSASRKLLACLAPLYLSLSHLALGATWDVTIQNFEFVPATLAIEAGDTVRWTQKDDVTHTTTSGANGVSDGRWDSGFMTPDGNSVFSFTFTQAGTYPYFCRLHKTSMRGSIVVTPVAQGPVVSLTSPANGTVFTAPATVTLTAQATAGASPVEMVHFYANSTQLAEIMAPPYTASLTNLSAGSYTFTARAMDSSGHSATSAPVTIFVELPSVQNPAYGRLLDNGNGWYYSDTFGWLWFTHFPDGWAWSSNLKGWLSMVGNSTSLWSAQFRWLNRTATDANLVQTTSLGPLHVGKYAGSPITDGWVVSDRFGYVWPVGDGVWFYSTNFGWLGVTADGGIWCVSQSRFL